jgi:hypothetical protein
MMYLSFGTSDIDAANVEAISMQVTKVSHTRIMAAMMLVVGSRAGRLMHWCLMRRGTQGRGVFIKCSVKFDVLQGEAGRTTHGSTCSNRCQCCQIRLMGPDVGQTSCKPSASSGESCEEFGFS